jgi:protein-S-isoprenylcysteine O-methyltransferase Ste14
MRALCVVILGLLPCIGCATMHAEESAALRVQCNVPEAAVLLDDGVVGRAAELAKKDKVVRAGFYRVEVRHPSYYPYFTEINVPEGGTATVKAELHPLLD